jgi:hypothetical protein
MDKSAYMNVNRRDGNHATRDQHSEEDHNEPDPHCKELD